jgi:hypothetical protein
VPSPSPSPLQVDKEMFDLNVLGTLSVIKAALPRLLAQQGGAVLAVTSSVAGKVGSPASSTYAATKGALNAFLDSLRMELTHRGISVVNMCPGPVQSDIVTNAFTEVPGQAVGATGKIDGPRMPTARAALLYAASLWDRVPEPWVSPQPILTFMYAGTWRDDSQPVTRHHLCTGDRCVRVPRPSRPPSQPSTRPHLHLPLAFLSLPPLHPAPTRDRCRAIPASQPVLCAGDAHGPPPAGVAQEGRPRV